MGEWADDEITENMVRAFDHDCLAAGPVWSEEDVGIPRNRHGHILCHYCGNIPKLIHDSTEVYGQNYGKLWICRACQAWVGCHPGKIKPLGRLADRELRRERMAAHHFFDELWKRKSARDRISYQTSRDQAYRWLAAEMGLTRKQCHIGHFDLLPCRFVIELCRPYSRRG